MSVKHLSMKARTKFSKFAVLDLKLISSSLRSKIKEDGNKRGD